MELTKREQDIFNYLTITNNVKDRMPTSKEVQYDCKIGRGNLQRILDILVKKGKLKRTVPSQIVYRIIN